MKLKIDFTTQEIMDMNKDPRVEDELKDTAIEMLKEAFDCRNDFVKCSVSFDSDKD